MTQGYWFDATSSSLTLLQSSSPQGSDTRILMIRWPHLWWMMTFLLVHIVMTGTVADSCRWVYFWLSRPRLWVCIVNFLLSGL